MVRFHRWRRFGVPVSFTVALVYLVAKRPPLWLMASARPAATLAIASGVEVPETALRVYSKPTPSRNTVHTAPTGGGGVAGSESWMSATVQARSLVLSMV